MRFIQWVSSLKASSHVEMILKEQVRYNRNNKTLSRTKHDIFMVHLLGESSSTHKLLILLNSVGHEGAFAKEAQDKPMCKEAEEAAFPHLFHSLARERETKWFSQKESEKINTVSTQKQCG